jgi:hypothetical protein
LATGCGTGKTYFASHTLPSQIPDLKPHEILYVTSRSITVDQQSKTDGITKYDRKDPNIIKFWNKSSDNEDEMAERGIIIMTYEKLIKILIEQNTPDHQTLERIKLIVFDECHTLFSDTFIEKIEVIWIWIRDCLYLKEKYLLGMTATPGIVMYNRLKWGVQINRVNKGVIPGYSAKQLLATNMETLPYLITSNILAGKTLIMCPTVKECYRLQKEIPNAAVLVSKNNSAWSSEMITIRDTIVEKETLPETFLAVTDRDSNGRAIKFEKRELQVLIMTSTGREGFNLRPESGIKNIVSCYGDSLYITQLLGRARFNIDMLVVADTYIRDDNLKKDPYLAEQRKAFKGFLYLKSNLKWFNDIAHLVDHGVYGTKRFVLSSDESRFIGYINSKWLAPTDAQRKALDRYKIWKPEDKEEIVKFFQDCQIVLHPQDATFNSVMQTLVDSLGYTVENGQQRFNKEMHRYRLIVSFDEDKITYEKIKKPLDGITELGCMNN